MNPFLFDGHLELEYASYRESTSSLLPSSSTSLSPIAVATTISPQQRNRYSPYARFTSQLGNSSQSAINMTRPIQQQHEAHSAEGGDQSSESLRSLNMRHRALIRALLDTQDDEELSSTLGGPIQIQSLRHSIELQELLVKLTEERDVVLGRMIAEGQVSQHQETQQIDPASPVRSESWSFLNLPTVTHINSTPALSYFSDSDEGLSRTLSHEVAGASPDMSSSLSTSWEDGNRWMSFPMVAQSPAQLQGYDNSLGAVGFGDLTFNSPQIAPHDHGWKLGFTTVEEDLLTPFELDEELHEQVVVGLNGSSGQVSNTAHSDQQHRSFVSSPQSFQQSSPVATTSRANREPRVAFSCDDCARMKKPCRKPVGPDGLINPVGDCLRCTKNCSRFGLPVRCTYVKSNERILKSGFQGKLIRDDTYTPDVG